MEGLDPDTDAAIAEALHACIQETDLDSRLDNVTERTVVCCHLGTCNTPRPFAVE